MAYVVAALVGMIAGGIAIWLAGEARRKSLDEKERSQKAERQKLDESLRTARAQHERLAQLARELEVKSADFQKRLVSYEELCAENSDLKHDVRNLDVHLRKIQFDYYSHHEKQEEIDKKSNELAAKYLKESCKWVSSSLTPNNYTNCRQRLKDTIEHCREIGFSLANGEELALLTDLKSEYEKVVRAAVEREQQARIKAQIREEQIREREIQKMRDGFVREQETIRAAIARALAAANNEHSAEVEHLKAKLAEAEERSQRAISQAQLTKAGHVYVISNIGSFGEGVYKIGMTRRLEPMDRVYELGIASVPFPFDVHMMISCDNAPSLENALHRTLFKTRLNKTNPRKEFFKTDLDAICAVVEKHHGKIDYVADAEALQYRQSLTMKDEDQEFIESVYEKYDEDEEEVAA